MTQSEYHNLSLSSIYIFHLYWGESKVGFIAQEDDYFYIVPPNYNREKSYSEVGYKVNLEFIESWEIKANIKDSVDKNSLQTFHSSECADILIIFGAGASYDYSFDPKLLDDDRPPLGNNLFSDKYTSIIQAYKGATSLSSEILKSKNIEEYFQKQWEKITNTDNKLLLSKLIDTQYYLRHLFHNISTTSNEERKNNYNILVQQLYNSLIEKGSNHRALLLTFNYDTLLETSIFQTLKYEFNNTTDYINHNERKLLIFKPHGSWNWGKKINDKFFFEHSFDRDRLSEQLSNVIYKYGYTQNKLNQYFKNDIEVVNPNYGSWQNEFFPNLLIPFSKKDEFIMPQRHFQSLEYFLPKVKKIIAIGWKGTEYAFQKLLNKHLSQEKVEFIYVNKNDQTFENEMKKYLPKAVFKCFSPLESSKGTFSEFTEYILEYDTILY